ncbi:MAG: hypothetical protein L3K05_07915, partial [Thermoplasmata archaeon]|nr:hypothetical protein [Thermoplasmata archaeon]
PASCPSAVACPRTGGTDTGGPGPSGYLGYGPLFVTSVVLGALVTFVVGVLGIRLLVRRLRPPPSPPIPPVEP